MDSFFGTDRCLAFLVLLISIGVDETLAKQVKQSKRTDKFKIIDHYLRSLIADYGTTFMDVQNDEPRLLSLKLANQMVN